MYKYVCDTDLYIETIQWQEGCRHLFLFGCSLECETFWVYDIYAGVDLAFKCDSLPNNNVDMMLHVYIVYTRKFRPSGAQSNNGCSIKKHT